MAYIDSNSDGTHSISLSGNSIHALSDYLEQCDSRRIAPETHLFLTATERLSRDTIVKALTLCINIIRIGTTLVFPNDERFAREHINANLPLKLALALSTLDMVSPEEAAVAAR